jgi:hypothetical protein
LAHQENVKKKHRQIERWNGWIKAIENGEKVLCFRCPGWITYDGKQFRLNKKAATVKLIFNLADQGYGSLRIIRRLNHSSIPPIASNSNSKWNDTYIRCLLRNKATIGTISIREKSYPNYLPAAIGETLFYRVQSKIRQIGIGGKPAKEHVNVFKGLLTCNCGAPLQRVGSKRGRIMLACQGARYGKGCHYHIVYEDVIEGSFMEIFRTNPEYTAHFEGDKRNTALDEINTKLAIADEQIVKLNMLILGDANPSKTLVADLKLFEHQKETLTSQLENTKANISATGDLLTIFGEFINHLHENLAGEEFRMKMRMYISNLVEKIVVDTEDTDFTFQIDGKKQKGKAKTYTVTFNGGRTGAVRFDNNGSYQIQGCPIIFNM